MTTKKKIILTILLAVLVGVGIGLIIYSIIESSGYINYLKELSNYTDESVKVIYTIWLKRTVFLFLVILFLVLSTIVFTVIIFLLNKKAFASLKYSFIDYQQERKKNKEKKQKQKIKILENRINNIKKDL